MGALSRIAAGLCAVLAAVEVGVIFDAGLGHYGSIAAAAAATGGPTTPAEGCSQDGLEKCGAELIMFASGPKVATTAGELKQTCGKEQASERCARDYTNKCLPRLPRGMVTLFLDGVKTEVAGKCKEGHAKNKDYLRHAKCMNEHGDKLHACMSQLVGTLDQAVTKHVATAGRARSAGSKADQKKQIKEACCTFAVMRSCMSDAVKGPCGPDAAKYIDGLVQGYAGDLLDTACAAHPTGDCAKTVAASAAAAKSSKRTPKNLLSPIARMVSALQTVQG